MRLSASGNRLTLTSPDRLVSGSINVFSCYFDFDSSWDGYFPTAVFESTFRTKKVEQAVINGECLFPFELLDAGARVRVGIYGVNGDKRRPTTYAEWMPVAKGTETGGAAETPPSPNVYESILVAITDGRLVGPSGPEGPPGPVGPDGYSPTVALTETESGVRVSVQNKDDVQSATVLNGKDGAQGKDGVGIQSVTQTTTSTEDGGVNVVTVTKTDGTTSTFEVRNGGGGTSDHAKLKNRDAADQHPMSAITGLVDELAGKQPTGNYLTKEQDPTVPEWAKQPQKPAYTAQEVGALPATTHIPTALSELSEDATHRVVTDADKAAWNAKSNFTGSYNDLTDKPVIPTVPVQSVNGKTGAVVLSADDVGALPASTVIPAPYTLPIASSTVLGGVQPVAKTAEMTQAVGVDADGRLWTAPGVGDSGGESGGDETTSNYVELGTLPYTVGNITELYLEPSEDCTLVIGTNNGRNLIDDLESHLVSSSNTVIDDLCSEEYIGTKTVVLTATNTNVGNNFYDCFRYSGLEVGKTYTVAVTVSDKRALLNLVKGTTGTSYGSVTATAAGERLSVTFVAEYDTVTIRLYMWTGVSIKTGDSITFSDIAMCEGETADSGGSSESYEMKAGEKTKVVFSEGTVIPAVDGVTVTVYKYVESTNGDLYVFLGDSIPCFDSNTGGVGAIPDYLREKCGGTWKNFCVGGTTMSAYHITGNGYEFFTLDEWADSIASGDFSNQEQGITDGASAGSTGYSISQKVSDAKVLDWSAVKRIFFAFGTNDLAYGVSEVGASTDTATKNGTMCAALKYAVQTIQTAYPTVEIAVCGIIYRYADSVSASEIIAANDAIRATCESIGVPFVPLFENMGVNEWNRTAFLYDGTHPNAAGKERYADTVKRLLCL